MGAPLIGGVAAAEKRHHRANLVRIDQPPEQRCRTVLGDEAPLRLLEGDARKEIADEILHAFRARRSRQHRVHGDAGVWSATPASGRCRAAWFSSRCNALALVTAS